MESSAFCLRRTDGHAGYDGCAIQARDVEIYWSIFEGNTSGYEGGAIAN